jgi:hypothetical protein
MERRPCLFVLLRPTEKGPKGLQNKGALENALFDDLRKRMDEFNIMRVGITYLSITLHHKRSVHKLLPLEKIESAFLTLGVGDCFLG